MGITACGGGGGGTGSSGNDGGSEASLITLRLLEHTPAADAVQVEVDEPIELLFDRVMALDCFQSEDTWLRVSGSDDDVPGTFTLTQAGRGVRFSPSAPLQAETDYVFQVGPLTCDRDGRILETTESFTFRTFDASSPTVVGANVSAGQTGRSRTDALLVTFSEAIDAASVTPTSVVLRDLFGIAYPCERTVAAAQLQVRPAADLPGDRLFTLVLASNVRDRAGNGLGATWSVSFRTAADLVAPTVAASWPESGSVDVSPRVQPTFTFSESMDPYTVEPSSLLFQDEFGSLVAFAIAATTDQRTLRVVPTTPLQADRDYSLAFLLGPAAATDVSGNGLIATQLLQFRTGSDATAPTLVAADPADGTRRVSPNSRVLVTFSEPLDVDWVDQATVLMTADDEPLDTVIDVVSGHTVRITPVLSLPIRARCRVQLRGGPTGIRDLAGNLLASDHELTFTVSDDGSLPTGSLFPADGAVAIPATATMRVLFDTAMDPATLTDTTIQLLDDTDQAIGVQLHVPASNRSVKITPTAPLQAGRYYRTVVRGGSQGVREASGNWLPDDLGARFRVGSNVDTTPPSVQLTLNGIDSTRREGVCLPPHGFTIDVRFADAADGQQDPGSLQLELTGPGTAPGTDTLLTNATIGWNAVSLRLPSAQPLATGSWSLRATLADLSGNVGSSEPIAFTVATATGDLLPFERTQVVWPRTDLDRDGNGTFDFDDDMVRLGLQAAGDPAGTNARMRTLLLDAILTQANRLLGRGDRGELLSADTVPLRFVRQEPRGVPHMQIALGGFDPEGSRTRSYGDASTGVLGRAWYDHRNSDMVDRNVGTSPGLGVFPSEMWLYQARIHRQVWPSFQTLFAQRFLSLCPAMGGTAAGAGELDATVLRAGFDYNAATSTQRARFNSVMQAVDDWSTVIGIILAHEVGHSVGLVAPGPAPRGLYGDDSLHDSFSTAAEVMAAAVGYESMITLNYRFRDIDLAYLRQRILLR